ncbi:MAG: zinc dependent phospholipase C family protein [Deltaproteobacteria bacterium]|nr:zinc dependent phospholipase C family protein [Deltaproteobacteria bacterium]
MIFVYSTFFLVALLLDPATVHAWGPGMHLDIALTVLQHATWALPAVRKIITAYSDEFIYGAVSPDIITGKKYAGAIHHCHNWSIGKMILKEAKTDAERASAWGYLVHLSADTVAHNYFVPFKIIRSFPTRALSHAYWEMRYDIFVPEKSWRELDHVVQHNYKPFDYLLERVLKKTIFTFRTNKRIFNSILILHRMKKLRFGLKTYAKVSRWELPEKDVKHYRELVFVTVKDFLEHPDQARCLQADPAGQRKLAYAAETRKELKRLSRKLGEKKTEKFLAEVKQKFEKSLFDEAVVLPKAQDFL